jgi:hypothetical protein
LQQEKKSIDDKRAEFDNLPKSWTALSTDAVPIKVLKRGDVQMPGDDAPPGALSAIRLPLSNGHTPAHRAAPGTIENSCNADDKPSEPADSHAPNDAGDIGIAPHDPDPIRRLKLAEWIVHPDNPLTWRVIVNRVWQYHFGTGLVATPSDFGAAGTMPADPELLDWLANWFLENGQSLKALHRLLVMSRVYRQSIDSNGVFPGRTSLRRLDAETLRDSILFVSGDLNFAAGGPSYRPFKYIDGNIPVYEPVAESPDLWRRTVYRHVIRTHRQPFLDTFDCPDPSVMTPVRVQTTTPLQALSLLNNPFVVEQSSHFAERVIRAVGSNPLDQARVAYQQISLADPSDHELQALAGFVREYGLDSLCRVLFNSNEFLYVD